MKPSFRLPVLPVWLAATATLAGEPGRLEFNRDIRPILSENCFHCHGQDAATREADLRLDERGGATRDLGGYAAIVPGKPEQSEVMKRLLSHDRTEMMPPPKSNRKVSAEQIDLIRRWIGQGAEYQKHWAYLPPRRAELPEAPDGKWAKWPRHPLDRLVLDRLLQEGLEPTPEASPETWLRRAGFDLSGLPPSPQELRDFAADAAERGDAAYEDAVDRLLQSPHFGERLAIDWLDAARYADTHGFNNDSARSMWRWRDWVIDAFNVNLPYDRFITEQLAGDLLPDPTLEQRIATGFSRNHVINSEGGIIDEEYRVEYVADRVRTTSTAWLGLTMECARCHDHKYDPITQRGYFEMFAFFNSVPEHGEDGRVANAVPMIPAPTKPQQAELAGQQRELAELDRWLAAVADGREVTEEDREEIERRIAEAVERKRSLDGKPLLDEGADEQADGQPQSIPADRVDFKNKEGIGIVLWLEPDEDNPRDVPLLSALNYGGSPADAQYGGGRELRLIDGEIEWRASARFPVYALVVRTEGADIRPGIRRQVALSLKPGNKAADVRVFVDGVEVPTRVRYDGLSGDPAARDMLVGADNAKDGPRWRGELDELHVIPGAIGGEEARDLFDAEALPLALEGEHEMAQTWLRRALVAGDEATRDVFARRAGLWEAHLALRRSLPTAMVMEELPEPRPAFVLERGMYDAPGDRVEPGVPEELIAPWPSGAPRNRLGLARWFTQPDHPLTARVVVNRFWAQLFGTGIVKTLEDFGSQSEWPSHPELLDWLARDFVDGGWDVKAFFKALVLSSTYRQGSETTPALQSRDPENRLLARGPRVRLPAELIRDQALAVSGLLTRRIGGPSVYPYQPDKLYDGVVVGAAYPGTRWLQGEGEDLYRRSLYTFWKRTVPHPAMLTLDAPDREFCSVRRSRTNTPLQALLLWNEPGYLEAARHLAARMIREGGADDRARLGYGFELVTGRPPKEDEAGVLYESLQKLRADFKAAPQDAGAFLETGASPVDDSIPPAELAAAMGVASMLLNLDETITKN